MNAFSDGLSAAMRARHDSMTSTGDSIPLRMRALTSPIRPYGSTPGSADILQSCGVPGAGFAFFS